MTHGMKSLENDRCTFGGSDRTPRLGVEAVTDVVEAAVTDEMLTCIRERLVQGVHKMMLGVVPGNPSNQPNTQGRPQPPHPQSVQVRHPRRWLW